MTQAAVAQPAEPATFVALDPRTQERTLLVEVHPELFDQPPETLLEAFQQRLFDRNIRVGLFVTPSATVVVRDTLSSMEYRKNEYDRGSINTDSLLRVVPANDEFASRVRTWLDAIAGSWHSFLPHEAVPLMVPDVVGNISEATFQEWSGVLGPDDCRG